MPELKKSRILPVAVVCLLTLGTAAAFAQRLLHTSYSSGRPEIKVMLSGAVEHGDEKVPVEKAPPVKPGETLDWNIVSENNGAAPAKEYKTVGQIPHGTQLVAGSANADGSATVVYSIDNGKSFSAQPTIEQKQADGSVKEVAAPVSMYTHLRYEWSDPLSVGGRLTASYKVRVN
jgi:uncharacterized repeat protein (TIGR01451 family)